MIYKNIEFHNVEDFIKTQEGVTWLRFPLSVCNEMDSDVGKQQCRNSTGVELRFIMKSESVILRMRDINPKTEKTGGFHIYRGGIQGDWEDHENNQRKDISCYSKKARIKA